MCGPCRCATGSMVRAAVHIRLYAIKRGQLPCRRVVSVARSVLPGPMGGALQQGVLEFVHQSVVPGQPVRSRQL
jgi:hypothetical protein